MSVEEMKRSHAPCGTGVRFVRNTILPAAWLLRWDQNATPDRYSQICTETMPAEGMSCMVSSHHQALAQKITPDTHAGTAKR